MGDEEPGRGACDSGFEVLCESPAASEPGEGAFDDPTFWQRLEAFGAFGALDDLDGPRAAVRQGVEQLLAAIDAVGEDVT